jgi:hypothetical protein
MKKAIFQGTGGCQARGFHSPEDRLFTEQEVAQSWRKLIASKPLTDEVVAKAEALIERLRPESPLRHRLDDELTELRQHRVPTA